MYKIVIGDNYKSEHDLNLYSEWISIENQCEIVIASKTDENIYSVLENADALILSGGSDVSPKFYNCANENLVRTTDVARDEFEKKILEIALNKKIPVLGVCRGLQFVNVMLGGTLYEDIQTYNFDNHTNCNHNILIQDNTIISEITKLKFGNVNSSHHQSVKEIGNGLIVSSKSEDGVVESLEWKDKSDKSFLLLVQWHPERLEKENPFSKNIKEKFINEIIIYSKTKK